VPLGLVAATVATAGCIAAIIAIRRGRARHWLPLRDQMVRDEPAGEPRRLRHRKQLHFQP
jgi:hypothetical protein